MIPFNKPYMTGKELYYIAEAHFKGCLSGDGFYTKKCHAWLEEKLRVHKALLTHSCTAALEMGAILANIEAGDEVIMPSYTFVSTANAFVLRGGVPVFVDVRSDTLNIDENKIEEAITSRTKAIVPVHYAGISCEMDVIKNIAEEYNLIIIEDAAQALLSKYKGQWVGTMGHLSCFSFHETKNIISGEGGSLVINKEEFIERAEILREKGTDRSRFFRGQVDKYTWQDVGSSYLPGELIAAFLWAQMEEAETITKRRKHIWNHYHDALLYFEKKEYLRRPIVPSNCIHNGHMYYILLPDLKIRDNFISKLKEKGVHSVFHYVPLHLSPAGEKFAKAGGELTQTKNLSDRIVRLPLWCGMEELQEEIINKIETTLMEVYK